jgi:hypothetical protein
LKAINATHDPSDRGTIDWPLAGIGVKAKDEWLEVKKQTENKKEKGYRTNRPKTSLSCGS